MKKKSWWDGSRQLFIKAMSAPFLISSPDSARTAASSKRERSPEVFLKRVTPQILEIYQRGLPYQTPAQWDQSFKILGGGQSRRTSSAILERMTWEQFLEQIDQIIYKSVFGGM